MLRQAGSFDSFAVGPEFSDYNKPYMPSVSTAKPKLTGAKTKLQKRDRLMGAIFSGAKTMLVSFGRTFYAFWEEIVGLFFLMFTVRGISDLVREYRSGQFAGRHHAGIVIITAICACFGVLSFRKAKRIRKS